MLRLLVLALLIPGCFFTEHGKGGGMGDDDDCILPPVQEEDTPKPGLRLEPVQPQRNPQTLTCQTFSGGGCNPECGPCPETDLAPPPSWGFCFSACEQLDEATCETDETCRVIKDATCSIFGDCLTDFLGCVSTDQFQDPSLDCTTITDADSCSRNPACTAYHVSGGCTITQNEPTCESRFAFCGPEGRGSGNCTEQAACDRLPPNCPSGTTPGVENGCFTDTCIPNEFCEGVPI
jgi:hypothetical protein